jgi:hypothetical protein
MISTLHVVAVASAFACAFAARAAPPDADLRVHAIRAEYQSVGEAMKNGELRVARFTLGGGQNPTDFEIAYVGVSESEAVKDPYASPFHPRRVSVHKNLPATGDATVEFTYDKRGKLLFAYGTGVDISGVTGFNDRPGAQVRVYFGDDEAAFRIVTNGDANNQSESDTGVTLDLASANAKDRARIAQAGAALVKCARVVGGADHPRALITTRRRATRGRR